MLEKRISNFTLKTEHLWVFALTLFFAIDMNNDWSASRVVWYGSLAVLLLSYIFAFNGRFLKKLTPFSIWLLIFMILCVVSCFWSLSADVSMDVIKSLIVVFAVLLLIHFSMEHGFDIDTMLKCYLVATAINTFYLVLKIDLSQLGETQLGTELMEGWNGNGIGFMMAQGTLVGFYLFERVKSKYEKILCMICVIAFAFLTLYTGSRTAFIILVAELALYFLFAHPKKMLRNLIIIVILLIVSLYLVMNVESLYNVLGSRLEGLFALFTGKGDVDSSSDIRNQFIENGKTWFLRSPLLGYGINNYKVLNQAATGRFTYAHNTFIELAVDLGAIGLLLYYSVYVFLIYKLFRKFKESPQNVFLLAALVASLISQYGTVSYYGFYQNFLIMLCFFVATKEPKEKESKQPLADPEIK